MRSTKNHPTETDHLMASALSDEAVENAAPYGDGATIERDGGFDADLEKFEAQLWDSSDPLSERLRDAKEADPSQAYRFLSDKVVKRRGMRGFKPVIDASGDPVSVAGMTLARMPQQYADKRAAHYANEYREQVADAVDKYAEANDRMIRESGDVGQFSTLKPGATVTDTGDPDTSASIGLTRRRGGRTV